MPMPVAGCAAEVSSDVCCDTWWLIGERIRTVAWDGLRTCIDDNCIDRQFVSYSTEGEPRAILGESLVVTFLRGRIVPAQTGRGGHVRPTPVTRLEFLIELRENNWPLPATADQQRQTIVAGDWEMWHVMSKHARGHGEKLWRSIVHAASTTMLNDRMFMPTSNPEIMERGITVGDIKPLPNTGPQVGYTLPISVDMQLKPPVVALGSS